MIISSRTPSRASLFGGGTDLEEYSSKYGGLTISIAINLYQELKFYTGEESWNRVTKFPAGISSDLAFSITKNYGMGSFHHCVMKSAFNGIVGAGLGSSGAFGVGLIAAIQRSRGIPLDRERIAHAAWIEESKLWTTGKQDQYAAAFGGFNVMLFDKHTEVIAYDREHGDKLAEYLHLFYTGGSRKSAKLQTDLTPQKIAYLHEIKSIAEMALRAIREENMELIGKLLHASWEIKRKMGASTEKIDQIYQYARENGALGGKLLGAGESGYCMFYVNPNKRQSFLRAMGKKGLEATDFAIDWNGVNTRIL